MLKAGVPRLKSFRRELSNTQQTCKAIMKLSTVNMRLRHRGFSTVLVAAGQTSVAQQQIRDMVIGGIVAAVTAATAGVSAAAMVASGVMTATVAAGSEIALSAAATTLVTAAAGNADLAQLVAPGETSPGAKENAHLKTVNNVLSTIVEMGNASFDLSRQSVGLKELEGEMQAYSTGGRGQTPIGEVLRLADLVPGIEAAGATFETDLESVRFALLDLVLAYSNAAASANERAMEQDMWIMWMSGLPQDSRVLDIDEIQGRLHQIGVLGRDGILGIDFGNWTFDAEEELAIAAAKDRVNQAEDGSGQADELMDKAIRGRYIWQIGDAPQYTERPDQNQDQGQGGASATDPFQGQEGASNSSEPEHDPSVGGAGNH